VQSIKDVRVDVEGGQPKVDDRRRVVPLNWTSISEDFEQIFLRFGLRIHTLPWFFWICVHKQHIPKCVAFRTFSRDMFQTSGMDGRWVSSKWTMLDRGHGGFKKSLFARTSLMDDPINTH